MRRARTIGCAIALLAMVSVAIPAGASPPSNVCDRFTPIPAFPDQPDRRFFPETGHSLAYGFKAYWEASGGLPIFGYPISEEFTERNADSGRDYIAQYFERAKFEYHPEFKDTPYAVELGLLGREATVAQRGDQPFQPVEGGSVRKGDALLYFPQTRHNVYDAFAAFWQANGGLPIFGYPLSEAFLTTDASGATYPVQWFERARFEGSHTGDRGGVVLLGLLGDEGGVPCIRNTGTVRVRSP